MKGSRRRNEVKWRETGKKEEKGGREGGMRDMRKERRHTGGKRMRKERDTEYEEEKREEKGRKGRNEGKKA